MQIALYILAGFGALIAVVATLVFLAIVFCWCVARWKISRDAARAILMAKVDKPAQASPRA